MVPLDQSQGGTPAISVVMPAHNAERYLDEAVQSVLSQSLTDFELVAVDDWSSDSTGSMLEGYARSDPRVVVVSTVGRGFVDALTTGIAAARSDLIARLDADDRARPDRLQRQWEFMSAHPEVGLLGSTVQTIDEFGAPGNVIRYPLTDAIIRLTLRHATAFAHGAVVMRRSALESVGGYSGAAHPADDYDLWCRIIASGVRGANLDEVLYDYRINDSGISLTRSTEMRDRASEIAAAYGRALRPRPRWGQVKEGVDEIDREVSAAEAAPTALRRASRSLLSSAPLWRRSSMRTASVCVAGALRAELRYRRARRR